MKLFVMFIAVFAIATVGAFADTVTGTGAMQSLTGPPFLGPGANSPFWNNNSTDLANGNIGYFLTGTGGFASNASAPDIPVGSLQYYASGTGTSIDNVSFTSVGLALNISIIGIFTGADFEDFEIGIVNYTTNTRTVLFDGVVPVGLGETNTITLPAGTSYGFYMVRIAEEETYHTQSQFNVSAEPNPLTHQHFAIFQTTLAGLQTFFVGIEDWHRSAEEGAGDYQDVVLQVTVTPEPSVMSMIGLGLAAVGFYGVRRRRRA